MSQRHAQIGIFNVTTNANDKIPWCTWFGIPEILIENLAMTRDVKKAQLYAFNVLPNHVHIIVSPGEQGLSKFMQSFKSNSMKNIQDYLLRSRDVPWPGLRRGGSAAEIKRCIAWQHGFHDEHIQDGRQCSAAMGYVQGNAMKHGLVDDIMQWPWSSLQYPHLLDPMELWLD